VGGTFQLPYSVSLRLFLPQLILAAVVVLCLSLAILRRRIATGAFIVAALLAPALVLGIGNPAVGVWPVSTLLLLLLAWRYRMAIAAQA
jgi:hypothetical protein